MPLRGRQALSQLGREVVERSCSSVLWNMAARGVALSERWDDDDELVRDATIRHEP